MLLRRRPFLLTATGAAMAAALPRFAIAQADQRPSITVAVQKLANSNTLEPLRESSNVGTRLMASYVETLTMQDWLGDLSLRPGLATAWRRVDERTLEVSLRPGVRFHDGRTMTAEDVVFSFGAERMGRDTAPSANLFGNVPTNRQDRNAPPEVAAIARRASTARKPGSPWGGTGLTSTSGRRRRARRAAFFSASWG